MLPGWAPPGSTVRAFHLVGLPVDALMAPHSPREYAMLTERIKWALGNVARRPALRGACTTVRSLVPLARNPL
jgi:hypothetical protein